MKFSAASGRGLIEANRPRRHAAHVGQFSAASGRGLIEAWQSAQSSMSTFMFSAASGRGLIEASPCPLVLYRQIEVFRGIGPRPH